MPNAINIILTGGLRPSTSGICGSPGAYFLDCSSTDQKDIIDSWDKLILSGYNTGAMIICQLVGAPINSDKLGYNTTIEDGMISTKKQSGGAQHVQIAAHTGCIKYVAAVFDEELLIEAFSGAMEAVRGYSPGMHQSLRSVKTFIESGSSNAKDEPMVRLQNTLVKTASKKPAPPGPPPPPPPPATLIPEYMQTTPDPWYYQQYYWQYSVWNQAAWWQHSDFWNQAAWSSTAQCSMPMAESIWQPLRNEGDEPEHKQHKGVAQAFPMDPVEVTNKQEHTPELNEAPTNSRDDQVHKERKHNKECKHKKERKHSNVPKERHHGQVRKRKEFQCCFFFSG